MHEYGKKFNFKLVVICPKKDGPLQVLNLLLICQKMEKNAMTGGPLCFFWAKNPTGQDTNISRLSTSDSPAPLHNEIQNFQI